MYISRYVYDTTNFSWKSSYALSSAVQSLFFSASGMSTSIIYDSKLSNLFNSLNLAKSCARV